MNTITLTKQDIHTGPLILVNETYPLVQTGTPPLVEVDSAYARVQLHPQAAAVLNSVLQTIGAGDQIVPVSGWRSHAEQVQIYTDSLRENGQAFTEKYVALPGHSEHQTGLAIDLGLKQDAIDFIRPHFPYTGICNRFRQKAVPYGFIERYEKGKEKKTHIAHEPWHFRYVGYPHAQIMWERDLTLEEYTDYLREFPYQGRHLRARWGKTLEIFHVSMEGCEQRRLTLPDCTIWQVSGNNVDGCVVTLWRD